MLQRFYIYFLLDTPDINNLHHLMKHENERLVIRKYDIINIPITTPTINP